ncbi:TonB-dependent receptor [Rhizorhapis sp.]|uniref:TonB-dependent receptor n=1 Tax=Rhizorhapis sp. TaxID=1968842 RepID=UPI002B464641|nr:TonB-dependent receptor [Rhizorhapis sp.]HKR17303.1 TonB-dependent receptor [Rhizorhapis sp.]
MRIKSKLISVSLVAVTYATAANAQVPSEPPASGAAQDEGIADIVVTAQRRAESAQDVPIAVTAFTGDQLDKLGVTSADDLPAAVPGLTISPNGGRAPIFLRGVGNNIYSTTPAVLTFIDGVYHPFGNTGGADYSNIQSIEVLKGPQGTLFGRNATGGVIQIRTKSPFDWQGVDAEIGYANYDTISTRIYAAAKLSENVAADVSGFYLNQDDGWGTNFFDGKDIYTQKRYGVRGKFVAQIDDTFDATVTADYSNRRSQIGNAWSPAVGYDFLFDSSNGQKIFLGPYDIDANQNPRNWSKEWGTSLTLDKRIGDIKLLSISSYRKVNEYFLVDDDGGPNPFFWLDRQDRQRVFTQEFQISGNSDRFNWVAGLYYYDARNRITGPTFAGPFSEFIFGAALGEAFVLHQVDRIKAYAGYAQGTLEVLPRTNLTLGARYTIEKRRLEGFTSGNTGFGLIGIPASPNPGQQKKTFKEPNFRVALDHKFTPNVLVYASWSRGFNAGFFSQQSIYGFNDFVNPALKPEIIDAYEIGLKSDLLNRRLRVNISAFLYDYTNLQQQVYVNGAVNVVNAGGARIKGIDFEVTAQPVRDLTLSIGGTYLDTKYTSYPGAPRYVRDPVSGAVAASALEAKGNEIVQAPDLSLQATAAHTLNTAIGTFTTTGNLNYVSKQFGDPHNDFPIRARTLIGLNEQWASDDQKTTITLWVKNLTNKKWNTNLALVAPTGVIGLQGAPRTYGVTLGRKF